MASFILKHVDKHALATREEFTAAGVGAVFEFIGRMYSIQVTGVDAAGAPVSPDAWIVHLTGSNDNLVFNPMLTHATGDGNGMSNPSGHVRFSTRYFRVSVAGLTLGAASKIIVSVTATP